MPQEYGVPRNISQSSLTEKCIAQKQFSPPRQRIVFILVIGLHGLFAQEEAGTDRQTTEEERD